MARFVKQRLILGLVALTAISFMSSDTVVRKRIAVKIASSIPVSPSAFKISVIGKSNSINSSPSSPSSSSLSATSPSSSSLSATSHNTNDYNDSLAADAAGMLPVQPSTFVYMVLGKALPAQKWITRASWPNVTVVFVAWQRNASSEMSLSGPGASNFHYYFFPGSTWTTARNEMLKYAARLEEAQQWQFEYLVFFDEDVNLLMLADPKCAMQSIHPGTPADAAACDNAALRTFRDLLLRDRPMQATISYPGKKVEKLFGCVRRCHVDHLIIALHRTAVDYLLPYDTSLDKKNWWSSAYVHNILMAAIAGEHCNHYGEIQINSVLQEHRYYPQGEKGHALPFGYEFYPARVRGGDLLAAIGVPGFRAHMSQQEVMDRVVIAFNAYNSVKTPCITHPSGVDFKSGPFQNIAERFSRIRY